MNRLIAAILIAGALIAGAIVYGNGTEAGGPRRPSQIERMEQADARLAEMRTCDWDGGVWRGSYCDYGEVTP